MKMLVKTLFGLEEVCAEEIKALGGEQIMLLNRAVKFEGDSALLCKANLQLRTALRVLVPIANFKAHNEHELYEQVKNIDWSEYLSIHKTFAVDGVTSGETFTHSHYVALKTKDAIADQFSEQLGKRPCVEVKSPDVRINVHIFEKECTISLDSSGDQLGLRGYRTEKVLAPLSEVLAAGIILLSGWDKKTELFDGMCGSGTFAIEAALIATNTPPGLNRKFGFQTWLNFNEMLWEQVLKEAVEQKEPTSTTISAQDISKRAMKIARANAERAGVAKWIDFKQEDFMVARPRTQKAHVILNPPYGERLQLRQELNFYRDIGSTLKHNFPGCNAWILSSNMEALKLIGLKPLKKIPLYNGKLECKLQGYELFPGKRKEHVRGKRPRIS